MFLLQNSSFLVIVNSQKNVFICIRPFIRTLSIRAKYLKWLKCLSKGEGWDFPGGSVVRTPAFHCMGTGLTPGWGNVTPPPKELIYLQYTFTNNTS